MQQLLKREGPKYQYGTGCLSDGVIGVWMARIYGIDVPLTRQQCAFESARHLQAQLQDRPQPARQRATARLRHGQASPGLLLCSWPRGNKPTLPFVYSDEVWTGIEYQVASHLIHEGLVDEGLDDREGRAQPLRRAHAQSVE